MIAIIVLWILLGIIAVIVIMLHFSVTVHLKGGTDGSFDLRITYMGITVYPRPQKNKKRKKVKNKDAGQDHALYDEEPSIFDDSLEDELSADTDKAEENAALESSEEVCETAEATDEAYVPEENTAVEELSAEKSGKVRDKKRIKAERAEEKKRRKLEKAEEKSRKKSEGKLAELKKKYAAVKPYLPMGWKYFKKLLKTIRFTKTKINITVGKEDAYESAMFYGKIQAALFNLLAVIAGIFTLKIKEANVSCAFNEKKFEAEGETVVRLRPSAVIAIAFCVGVNFLMIYLPQRKRKKKALKRKEQDITSEGEKAA